MMIVTSKSFLSTSLLLVFLALAEGTNKTIYVIRHGEKTYDYNKPKLQTFGCLSQRGWARAYNLVSLFGVPGGKYATPQAIFSAQYDGPGTDGIGVNCRDENGWFRTQQTVSAVAAHLNLEVNNQTGFVPRFCLGQEPGPGACIPYSSNPPEDPHGDCCNPWAATQMIDTFLTNEEVDSILVAWEHKNIQFLSTGLANFPDGNPAVETVRGQVSYLDAENKSKSSWEDDNYDYVYQFHYDCNATACEFLSLTNDTLQGFQWLGPSYGCGFSTPDIPEVDAQWVENDWECIFGSSCPVCPTTTADDSTGEETPAGSKENPEDGSSTGSTSSGIAAVCREGRTMVFLTMAALSFVGS